MRPTNILKELDKLRNELSVVNIKETSNHECNFLSIKNYQVILKNGAIFNREKLVKRGSSGNAVIIVPITEDSKSFVIVEPRVFTSSGTCVEVPAGYIDDGETEIEAAKRELKEELGCTAKELIPLKSFYQDQGISGAYNTCFLALGCKETHEQSLDKDEYIKYKKCSLNDLYYLVDTGVISDAGGIIAIGEAKKYLDKLKRKNKSKGE